MVKIILNINGMACGMCEAHVNDAIREHFPIKKVNSSHIKGTTEILAENPLDGEELRAVIDATGYKVTSVSYKTYEKKGFSLAGLFRK